MLYANFSKKDTLFDYTNALTKYYEKLPQEWINYFIIRLSNLISYNLHWKNVYAINYIHEPEQLILTGFPPIELRKELNNWDTVFLSDTIDHHHNDGKLDEYIDVNLPQLDYVVHKLNYKQAVVYMRGKDIIQVVFYKEWHDEEKPCAYIQFIQSIDDLDELTGNELNCNILTPSMTPVEHKCKKCNENCPHNEETI